MQKDIIENFQKMTQITLENFKKLGETNLRIGERLLQEQVKLTNSILESAASSAEEVTELKDIKEVASKQAEWAQDSAQKVMASCRTYADIMTEAGKTYSGLFESSMKAAGCASPCSSDKSGDVKSGRKAA